MLTYIFSHQWKLARRTGRGFKYSQWTGTWATVRYHLEQSMQMHDGVKGRRHTTQSYLRAHLATHPGEFIADDFKLSSSDCLVLSRHPLPRHFKPYTPPQFRNHHAPVDFSNCRSEKSKMQAVLKAASTRGQRYQEFHPSAFHQTVPDWYVCGLCGAADHVQADCRVVARTVIPMSRRKKPAGIPRSQLRLATEAEIRTHAMPAADGRFYVRKLESRRL